MMLKIKNGDKWVPVSNDIRTPSGDVFALITFDGDNGDTYLSSGVSSVDKIGKGNYNINLEFPQPDLNFGIHVTPGNKMSGYTNSVCAIAKNDLSNENYVNVYITYFSGNGCNIDPVNACFFRL